MPKDENELISLEVLDKLEGANKKNYFLVKKEIQALINTGRAAHKYKLALDGAHIENEKLREELKQEQIKRHEMAKRYEGPTWRDVDFKKGAGDF
jgi:hypothetical protein